MWISLALNAVLSLGIVLLLSTADAGSSNLKLCADTTTAVSMGEIAQAGKVRYRAIADVEQPGNVMRRSASLTIPAATRPAVSYVRCLQS
jgi:hypothetical protein